MAAKRDRGRHVHLDKVTSSLLTELRARYELGTGERHTYASTVERAVKAALLRQRDTGRG